MRNYTLRQIRPDACVVEIEGLTGGGPYAMGWNVSLDMLDDRICQLADWLAEWQVPAAMLIEKVDEDRYRLSVTFGSPEHARACYSMFSPCGRKSAAAGFHKVSARRPSEH